MNDVTQYHDDDDGFDGTITGGRLIKGVLIKWNETHRWLDRDGLRPPEILLVLALAEAFQRFKDKRVIGEIKDKPLPEVETLNATIPVSEWELGLNNQPKPPWSHQRIVYLIDPATAQFYTHLNNTVGMKIAWENLRERVITMRALRGARVLPLVKLGQRPMKTSIGVIKQRPEYEIVGWRTLGGEGSAIPGSSTPQITGPTKAEAKTDTKPQPASEAAKTIAALGEVKLPTAAEEVADEIPF